jgi:hypothetical protein
MLEDRNIVKIFHYARFDVAMLKAYLGADVGPLFCTKVASRLVRTYTDRHGLKDLVREMLGIDVSKQQQSSDWGTPVLSDAQKAICRPGRDLSARTQGAARPDAQARRPRSTGARLLCLPCRCAPRLTWRLGRRGHLCALICKPQRNRRRQTL